MFTINKIIFLFLYFFVLTSNVNAAPITSLYSTGVDSNNVGLSVGAAEIHYSILDGSPSSLNVTSHYAYLANNSESAWINGLANGHSNETYVTTFDLTGFDLSTVSLDLDIAVDNTLTDVLINDISTGFSIPYGFPAFQSFSSLNISSNFLDGINTLKFVATNNGGPGAFRVNASGSATAVPEPSILALMGLGLAGLGFARRRRTQA